MKSENHPLSLPTSLDTEAGRGDDQSRLREKALGYISISL